MREFSGKRKKCAWVPWIELIFMSLVSKLLVPLDSSLCYI